MSLIECPDCNSKVSDQAHACPQCGRPLRDVSNALLPQYDVELSRLDVARVAGLFGSVMLALGVFLPYVNVPLIGPVNLFFNGKGVGVFLLVAGILGFLAILRRSQVLAGFLGISSLATLAVHFFVIRHRLEEAAERAAEDLDGNPFAALATGALDAVQVQSGFGVMLIGAALLVVGGFLSKFNEESSEESTRQLVQNVAKVQTWVTGAVRPGAVTESRRAGNGDDHERNAWVREQFELWLIAEVRQQPRNASERLALFADFRARLERGEIDMVALRNASAAARKGERVDAASSSRTDPTLND